MVSFIGQMVKNMKDNGKIIKCMDMVNLDGQMEEYIEDNINLIKKMDSGNSYMMKIQNTRDNGLMVNNKEKA